MFTFYACDFSCIDNKTLILHVDLSHKSSRNFRYSEIDCSKTYYIFDSYRKHRLTKHSSELLSFGDDRNTVFMEETAAAFDDVDYMHVDNDDSEVYVDSESSSDEFDEIFDSEIFSEISNTTGEINSNPFIEKVSFLIAKLYKFADVPRARTNDIISDMSVLFEEQLKGIQDAIRQSVTQLNRDFLNVTEIDSILLKFTSPFQNMATQAKRFAHFRQQGTFILPENYKLGEVKVIVENEGEKVSKHKDLVAQFIPLRKVLKLFFEMPTVLDKTLQYLNDVQQHSLLVRNIVQGPLWKEKIKANPNKIILPTVVYVDDYENNNPLGSHKGVSKCSAAYYSVVALPPELQSRVNNIFLFLLFNSKHRSHFTNRITFTKAIEEIQYLEQESISVTVGSETKQLHFLMILMLGDNLGLHQILGFVESFTANYFCRFCLVEHKNFQTIFNERDCVLRTPQNYETLASKSNVSASGIKEMCVFNVIDSFHVTDNLIVDPQHDLLEDILRYDLAIVLNDLIYIEKLFSLHDLNLRLSGYQYGADDNINKPQPVSENHIKKGYLIMSSAEMLNLIRCLFLVVGPFIPEQNVHWQLLIKLRKIVEIVFSKVVHKNTYKSLDSEITEYLTLLSFNYPNQLKPKHHFLLHYPRIMKAVGPLPSLSCMRFESKHRDAKITSHVL